MCTVQSFTKVHPSHHHSVKTEFPPPREFLPVPLQSTFPSPKEAAIDLISSTIA